MNYTGRDRPRRLSPAEILAERGEIDPPSVQGEIALPGVQRRGRKKGRNTVNVLNFNRRAESHGIPKATGEHFFIPNRMHRLDLAWPTYKVAIEVQGGVWNRGAHGRGSGIVKDYWKLNEAQLLGWIVLQVPFGEYLTRDTFMLVARAIRARS